MSSEFKVGDKVRIRKSSQWYTTTGDYQNRVNPKDVTGVITDIHPWLTVSWPACYNSYAPSDLERYGSILHHAIFSEESKRKEIL